jgi:hypothetical protein
MPGSAGRRAAIVLALAVAACGTPAAPTAQSSPSASPLPAASSPSGQGWVENLTFSGDFTGTMTVIAPNQTDRQSECSGKNSRTGGTWASIIFGPVGNQTLGVSFLSSQYRGPGIYSESVASAQVFTPDHAKAWQSVASDSVKFTVNSDEESGMIDATLTNLINGTSKLQLKGNWSCRT